MQTRTFMALLLFFTLAACGTAEEEDMNDGQPLVGVTVAGRAAGDDFHTSAAVDAGPTTLLFALIGPGGTRSATADFAAHEVSLPQLQRGTWSIRGDGLDARGKVGWNAKPVIFKVEAGKRVPITLVFEPVP